MSRKPPQKSKTPETLLTLLTRDYHARLNTLEDVQSKLTRLFHESPIYEEYQRRNQTEKLYRELEEQHKKSLNEVNKLYKVARKNYQKWLKLIASIQRKQKFETWMAKKVVQMSSWLGTVCGKLLNFLKR